MTSIHTTLGRPPGDGLAGPAPRRPRMLLDWEDLLTLCAALVAFVSVGFSLQAAGWVKEMPPFLPTVCVALLAGMVGARSRLHAAVAFPLGLAAGTVMVLLAALIYVEGATISDRLLAFRTRMQDWFTIVRAGDVSNDNLPFVVLVHALTFFAVFFAAWSIYRWRSVWPAVIPAAVIVLANIAFIDDQPVAPFIVFIFGAIVLVGRMHIQKNIARWTAEGVEYPEFISLSTVQLTAFAGAVIVTAAWLLPLGGQGGAFEAIADTVARPVTSRSDDFVRLFSNLNTGKGGNLHNFGKTLPIRGDVSLGRKKLLEVTSSEPGLVRATSYDIYTGAGWKKGSREDTEVLAAGAGAAMDRTVDAIGPYAQRQLSQIEVLVVDPEDTIITAGVPLAVSVDAVARTPAGATEADELRSAADLEAGDTYTSIGSVSTASAEQLAAAGTDYPGWVAERYLQLPEDLPARVQGETVRIITEAGARTPFEAAAAIEAYLGAFPYDTLVEAPPPGRDAVDFLLFDLQKGYFDYQSSAMCVMLRTVGVPCRVTVGYVLDPDNALADVYTVRKTQAYSWVEVFFPTYGWVDFNPSIAPLEETIAGPLADGLSEEPPIVDLPAEELFGPAIDLGDVDPGAVLDSFNDAGDGGGFNWLPVWVLVGVLGIVAAGAGTARLLWVRGLGGMDADRRLWAKTQRLAGWAGLGIAGGETAREWSGRMGDAVGLKPEAERLAAAYEAQRYGPPASTAAGSEEVEGAYRRLRGALTRKMLRRW